MTTAEVTEKQPRRKFTEEENIAFSKMPNTKSPEQLAEENMAFVYHLVDKEFSRYYRSVGIPREVLVSAGMLGLVKAANRSKYGTFIRYASFWIRYYIYAEIRGYFFIKRQSSYCLKLNKLRREQTKFENENGRKPSYAELAKLTGIPEETVYDVIEFDKHNSTSTFSLSAIEFDADLAHEYDKIISEEACEIDFDPMTYTDLRKLVEHYLFGNEKQFVIAHFFEHKTPIDIAREYGMRHSTYVQKCIRSGIENLKRRVALVQRSAERSGIYPAECAFNIIADKLSKTVKGRQKLAELPVES